MTFVSSVCPSNELPKLRVDLETYKLASGVGSEGAWGGYMNFAIFKV